MAAQPGPAHPGTIWDGTSWVIDPNFKAPPATKPTVAAPPAAPIKPPKGFIPYGTGGAYYDPTSGTLWKAGSEYNPYTGAGISNSGMFSPQTISLGETLGLKANAPVQTQATYNPNAPPPELNALRDLARIDPTGESIRTGLGTGYLSDLNKATAGQLPPGVMREIQQDVRGNQAARGNYEGVAQAAQEGETTGTAGLQYLNNVRSAALGYLGSGQSKYGAGSQYVDRALNQQSAALTGQMTPTYNPNTGTPPAYQFIDPNYGQRSAQGTQGFYSSGVGATPGSPDTSGQYIGAGIGALGSIGGAAVTALFCQAARVIYGDATPEQLMFRDWILFKAPAWLRTLYARYAEKFGNWIADKPIAKWITRMLMDRAISHQV